MEPRTWHQPRLGSCAPRFESPARTRQDSRFWVGKADGWPALKPVTATACRWRHRRSERWHLTSPGSTLGTVAYMSPGADPRETTRHSHRSIFVWRGPLRNGHWRCCLFTGESTGGDLRRHHESRATIGASAAQSDIFLPKLEDIINRALEKDRDLRYQHASDLRVGVATPQTRYRFRPLPRQLSYRLNGRGAGSPPNAYASGF